LNQSGPEYKSGTLFRSTRFVVFVPSSGIFKIRKHNVLKIRAIFVLRWGRQEHTLFGTLEIGNPQSF
jgi:hypothetical protein